MSTPWRGGEWDVTDGNRSRSRGGAYPPDGNRLQKGQTHENPHPLRREGPGAAEGESQTDPVEQTGGDRTGADRESRRQKERG